MNYEELLEKVNSTNFRNSGETQELVFQIDRAFRRKTISGKAMMTLVRRGQYNRTNQILAHKAQNVAHVTRP